MTELEFNKIPTISVIIPLYNAEKYIAQCLGSILNQTFQDFEVIVVDDCSTDNSVAIVEKMAEKSNGKITLVKSRKNSGGSAVPRNIGLGLSRGKYILFIDNDDMIVNNALEMLYNIAEQTQADVLHAEKWFEPQQAVEIIDQNTKFIANTIELGGFVNEITIETYNLAERMQLYAKRRFHWHVWNKFFRRDFLIENNINFPPIVFGEDTMFCFFCLCHAKKYVRIPNIFYIWHIRETSASHKIDSIGKYVHKYLTFFIECTKILNDFMNKLEFFIQNPKYKHLVIQFFIQDNILAMNKIYISFPLSKIISILDEEIAKVPNDDIMFTTYLFNLFNIYRLQFEQAQQKIISLEKQLIYNK